MSYTKKHHYVKMLSKVGDGTLCRHTGLKQLFRHGKRLKVPTGFADAGAWFIKTSSSCQYLTQGKRTVIFGLFDLVEVQG